MNVSGYHKLQPLEIVVINTRAGARYGDDDYVNSFCGVGREATLYLLERGVRLTGTDGWSWDVPFVYTAERYRKTGNAARSECPIGSNASMDIVDTSGTLAQNSLPPAFSAALRAKALLLLGIHRAAYTWIRGDKSP